MNQRELFAVLLKAIGILQVVSGIAYFPTWLTNLAYQDWREFLSIILGFGLSVSGMGIFLGCVLFFGAGWFSEKVYPGDDPRR